MRRKLHHPHNISLRKAENALKFGLIINKWVADNHLSETIAKGGWRMPLSKEKERQLVQKAQKGDKQAQDELVIAYLGFIKWIAKKVCEKWRCWDLFEDLVHEGVVAFIGVIQRFHLNKGTKLTTPGYPRVKGAMLNFLSKEKVQISRTLKERVRQVDKALDALTQKLQRKPTDEEVAKATGMSIQQVEEALFWLDFALESLEALNEKAGADWQPASQEESQEEVIIKQEEYQQLEVVLHQIAPRRRLAIVLRFWEDLPLREIGEIMDIKENAVKQLLHNALNDLRKRYGVMDAYGGDNHA